MATTTDRATVDSGEGTYVWDFSQDACPDTLVSLYSGPIKVLTNSMTTFTDGTAIMSGREKKQVAGLELKETMVLCGRAAEDTHQEHPRVLPSHGANPGGVGEVQPGDR
jgi:hypothetical protein